MTITPIPSGMKRAWVECKTCGRVAYYDYIPYGLGNPIMCLPCGHGLGQRFSDSVRDITADEALVRLNR